MSFKHSARKTSRGGWKTPSPMRIRVKYNTTVGILHLFDIYLELMQASGQSSMAKPCDARTLLSKIFSHSGERIGTC